MERWTGPTPSIFSITETYLYDPFSVDPLVGSAWLWHLNDGTWILCHGPGPYDKGGETVPYQITDAEATEWLSEYRHRKV